MKVNFNLIVKVYFKWRHYCLTLTECDYKKQWLMLFMKNEFKPIFTHWGKNWDNQVRFKSFVLKLFEKKLQLHFRLTKVSFINANCAKLLQVLSEINSENKRDRKSTLWQNYVFLLNWKKLHGQYQCKQIIFLPCL